MTTEVQISRPLLSVQDSYDSYEQRNEKALQLLKTVLPEDLWPELMNKGIISLIGKRGKYILATLCQTEIRNPYSDRRVAFACLQLSITAPAYDRMIAEYLLIKNDESTYWKTANIFSRNEHNIAIMFFIVIDIVLLVTFLLTFISIKI